MTNIQLSLKLIQELAGKGINTFCVSPSSRNAPIVEVLTRSQGLHLFSFFDERSAGFYAFGQSKKNHRPAAVAVTSGTAVCELLPAVCTAFYSSVPLVLITADRPSDYQGTSAPQCIDQTGLFSKYVSHEWDLEIGKLENLDLSSWNGLSSIHINVRFDEPLIDEVLKEKTIAFRKHSKQYQEEFYFLKSNHICQKTKNSLFSACRLRQPAAAKQSQSGKQHTGIKTHLSSENSIKDFFKKSQNPIILAGELPCWIQSEMIDMLKNLNLPIYAEPLSQLRETTLLQHLILKSGENILPKAFQKNLIDGVVRIGAVPTVRFWRDLNFLECPVLSLSLSSFSGLKNQPPAQSLKDFFQLKNIQHLKTPHQKAKALFDLDKKEAVDLKKQILSHPEWSWMKRISEKIPENSHIFLGNSLPIREWDLCASRENKNWIYSASRGANGIDGLLSAFLGLCSSNRPNYCILGDLSLLYDLSAPWILKELSSCSIHIIVIHNGGGQIFKKFQNTYFLNQHCIDFQPFAQMWNLNYKKLKSYKDFREAPSPSLMEISIKP